jgi:hypothetical protein
VERIEETVTPSRRGATAGSSSSAPDPQWWLENRCGTKSSSARPPPHRAVAMTVQLNWWPTGVLQPFSLGA